MHTTLKWMPAIVFFSGFCSLVYQVTWLRLLRLIFGASTPATAIVLAIFMGGLGLGGLLLPAGAPNGPQIRWPSTPGSRSALLWPQPRVPCSCGWRVSSTSGSVV